MYEGFDHARKTVIEAKRPYAKDKVDQHALNLPVSQK